MAEQTSRLAVIIDSTGAEKNAESLTSSLHGLTEWGMKAAASAGKVTKASKEESQALSQLLDRIDPVNAALNKLDEQQKQLTKFKAKGFLDADTFDLYAKKIDETRTKLTGITTDMGKAGMSAKQMANNMRMLPAQMTDIFVGLSTGQSPFMVLMQQGGQLKDIFGGVGPAIKAVGGYIVGLINPLTLAAGAVGALGYAYYQGSKEQSAFNQSLIMTGNIAGKTAGQLSDIAQRVSIATNATTGNVAAVLNQLVSSGKVAGNLLESVTTAITNMSETGVVATEQLISEFDKIADNPTKAIAELNEKYHFLTQATYNQIKALQDEGNQQEAARLATETYANAVNEKANLIKGNLGALESAWKFVADAAKSAWDAMMDVGRTQGPEARIAEIRKRLDWIDNAAGGNTFFGGEKSKLQQELATLQSMSGVQEGLTKFASERRKAEDEAIKTQQAADRANQQFMSNAEKRNKAIQEQKKFLDAGAISAEKYAQNVSRINEMYKDPKASGGNGYSEDAGQRLLDQIRSQTEALQAQLNSSEKLNSVTQQRIKFESQITELQRRRDDGGKLTKEQQSLLSRSDEIINAYKTQEAISNQTKTLDDYQKLQDAVRTKEQKTNDLLKERLELLQQVKATGKVSDADIEATRKNVLNNTNTQLPDSVTKLTKNQTPTGGELSGSWDGMLQQAKQLQQAQSELEEWNNRSLESYRLMYEQKALTTAEYEQKISDTQQKYRQTQEQLDAQKNQIVTTAIQSTMDSTTSIMRTAFGEQSALYKISFAASKAYAIAQSIVAINAGIAQAANNPFPANLVAMASVAANTAGIVANIAAVAGTGFKTGGYTGNAGVNSVAGVVHGKEFVFDAASTKKIGVSNLESIRKNGLDATLSKPGFGTGAQNVSNNNQSSTVFSPNVTVSNSFSGKPDDATLIAINQSNKQLAKQLRAELTNEVINPQGSFGNALKSRYNRGYKI